MDLIKDFEELKNAPKNDETIDKLQELLKAAKEANDSSLYMDIILKIEELYKYKKQHEKAIFLLEEVLNEEFIQTKAERLKIIDELINILLKTEDFVKLKSLLFDRTRYLTTAREKIMQSFYMAVCHEGLLESQKAIDNLLEIPDNISSNILVNKYLKLAMLYLKLKDLNNAIKMYDLATKFDSKTRNPIFKLVLSDIAYYQKEYSEALNYYQEYFIKTKNKHRYLERFILINIAMHQYDEAWQFYQEYLPKMNQIISKNYRIVFYQAAIELCKHLNNQAEIEKLNVMIESLKDSDKPIANEFDNVYQILNVSFQNKTYYKERNIIFDVFKALTTYTNFQKLVFAKVIDENIHILHYSKGLLLEKTLKPDDYKESIFNEFVKNNNFNFVYEKAELEGFNNNIFKTEATEYVFVNEIKRQRPEKEFLIVFSDDLAQYDYHVKIIFLAKEILTKLLNDFYHNINQENLIKNYKRLFDQEKVGLIKIKNNFIHLLNEYAKDILLEHVEYLDFNKFQERLIGKDLYIDDLLKIRKEIFRYSYGNLTKVLELSVVSDEFEIYAIVKDISDDLFINKSYHSNLVFNEYPSIYQMIDDLNDNDQKTILAFKIFNASDYFKDYSINKYKDLIMEIIKYLKEQSRTHLQEVYLESVDSIYLVLKTIDKRVLQRIINNFIKTYTSQELNYLDFRISGTQISHRFTNEILLKLKYLLSITSENDRYLFDNKNFKYNQELAKTIFLNVKKLIEEKTINLKYQAIGLWESMEEKFLHVRLSDKLMLGDKESLARVIKANNLENDWNLLIVKNLVKEINKSGLTKSFAFKLYVKALENEKTLKKIISQLEKAKISANQFMLIFDMKELVKLKNRSLLNYLKTKDYVIGLENWIDYIGILNMDIFEASSYLFVENNNIVNPYFKDFRGLLKDKEIVLFHKNETLRKSILQENKVNYVEGSLFPTYKSLVTK